MATDSMEERGIDETPAGQAKRWGIEFAAARKDIRPWQDRGEKIVRRFVDERDDRSSVEGSRTTDSRLNLFTANIQTIRAIMYGKTPKVDVARRFEDSSDDVARVSAEMLERILNADIQRDGDTFSESCGNALDDRLLPGAGFARLRYCCEWEDVPEQKPILGPVNPLTGEAVELAPAVPATQRKAKEYVETDYVFWKDVLWNVDRTWAGVRWMAFCSQLPREALKKKFGDDVGERVPLKSKRGSGGGDSTTDDGRSNPWGRADVWEVWSKEDRKVYFFVEGYPEVLKPTDVETEEDGGMADPLGLDGFYPTCRPMMANLTTTKFLPTPDFVIAQDLYNEVDLVTNRITALERAVRVRGVYDAANPEIARLMNETPDNGLTPVKNFQLFGEKGGLKGAVDWMPLDMIVNALSVLRDYRTELTTLLYQVTGMSDIIRGQAQTQTTATEQSIKAKFASVRLQATQDEFARFASDLQRLKAEIISKHFDEATILEAANMAYTADAKTPELVQKAVQLIKEDHFQYRIEVKPESVSLTDYASVKQERTEVISALAQYYQGMAPMLQFGAVDSQFVAEVAQWMVSGVKGGSSAEGMFDQMLTRQMQAKQQAAMNPPPPPPPDPKLQATQMKGQMDMQKAQFEHQATLQTIAAQSQADTRAQAAQAHFNILENDQKERSRAVADVAKVTGQV